MLVLIITFAVSAIASKLAIANWNLVFSGNLAMCIMMCFASLGHFVYTKGMVMMIPGFIPLKRFMVYFTGVAEIAMGVLLLFPQFRFVDGIILLAFFVLMLPANIYAAINHINFEKATYEGKGLNYLWFRVPLQVLFITWVYIFSISHIYGN